jgi:proteasome lid subunit RPN8/RPN11
MSTILAVKLPSDIANDIIHACRSRLPHEICGAVYGYRSDKLLMVDGFSLIRNVSPSPVDRFEFDRNDWISACYEAQKNQRNIVGLFHSHPNGSIAPSARDEQALVPWVSYWIVSFAENRAEITIYKQEDYGWTILPLSN